MWAIDAVMMRTCKTMFPGCKARRRRADAAAVVGTCSIKVEVGQDNKGTSVARQRVKDAGYVFGIPNSFPQTLLSKKSNTNGMSCYFAL